MWRAASRAAAPRSAASAPPSSPPPCLPLHKSLLPQKIPVERPHRCISNRLTAAWILPGTSWSRQKCESRGRSSWRGWRQQDQAASAAGGRSCSGHGSGTLSSAAPPCWDTGGSQQHPSIVQPAPATCQGGRLPPASERKERGWQERGQWG